MFKENDGRKLPLKHYLTKYISVYTHTIFTTLLKTLLCVFRFLLKNLTTNLGNLYYIQMRCLAFATHIIIQLIEHSGVEFECNG